MSYREKESIINIVSGVLITLFFGLAIYNRHLDGRLDLSENFSQWGTIFLIYIGINIVARIIIYILFHIGNAIATQGETDIPAEDERDKLVKLKATRNAYYALTIGFVLAAIGLAAGMPAWGLFVALFAYGLLTEIVENLSHIYYYRKGV